MDELRFDGRVAVVTGAGRGIGRAHAMLLASRGGSVVVADIGARTDGSGTSSDPADEVVAEIESAGGAAVSCVASVAEEAGAQAIVDTAISAFGRLDIVVNNAGIADQAPFDELTVEQFRLMMDVHYFGTLFVTRSAWPHLTSAGSGRIVNTVSESMLGGLPRQTSYAAAKGAILGLTKSLSTEAAPLGIKVNAIAPRAFTRMAADNSFANASEEQLAEAARILAPELNSPAVGFLAHESCPLNGEILRPGMGSIARLALVHTKGLASDGITIEDIAENLDAILDVTGGSVTETGPLKREI